MFERLDLFRDDTPTPRPSREATPRQDTPTPRLREDRGRDEQRTGHRREHDDRESARSIGARKRAATADVGMYRAVSYQDLSAQHFDGHPYATRRAVDQLVRRGLVREHQAEGPHGGTYTVLTATPAGARVAQRAAQDAGHDAGQQTWSGLVKPAELAHDTAVYRAARHEQGRIEAEGGRVTRVRIDAELKQVVARATETARAAHGRAGVGAPRAGGPRPVSRRAARTRGPRGAQRTGECRGRVRALPRGGDRGEGRRGLCPARQQRPGSAHDRPRDRQRRQRRRGRTAWP